MYSMPAAPGFGLALSPTPSVSFLTAARLTPARSLREIRHSVHAAMVVAVGFALTAVAFLPALSSTTRYKGAGNSPVVPRR